jgi:2,5-diamino-6-(ribosylamino)-4(3H)-pyrimidinone 5'-phosphate reductase
MVVSRLDPGCLVQQSRPRESIPYLVVGDERVDLAMALLRLNESLGVETVISEGAGRLNGALLRAGLIDDLHLEIAPIVIGGSATPSLFDGADLMPDQIPARFELVSVAERPEGRVRIHYRALHDESQ